MLRPDQEIELTYISYLNAIYFYCVDCRKAIKNQGVDDEVLADYLTHRQISEVLSTLPSSSERKTFEAQTLAETVDEERKIHEDAMKAMDRWYIRNYEDLKEDWKRKDLRIRELEEENRTLKRQLETQIQVQQPKRDTNIHSVRPFFSNLLSAVIMFGGIQYR